MRIGICDDDIEDMCAAEKIIQSCGKDLGAVEVYRFQNTPNIVAEILDAELDVLLLDIEMPGRNGIEIGDAIAERTDAVHLIFLTNREDMVFRAIHCHPYRFIRKSHMETELREALLSVMQKLSCEQMQVCFEGEKDSVKLRIRDILYIESDRHYLMIHEKDKTHRLRGKLSEHEERLQKLGFIRIHRSYLVNVRYIQRITICEVQLDTGEVLAISRKYSQTARDAYNRGVRRFINGIHI